MSDDTNTNKSANSMWGGRFSAGPSAIMEAINASIDVDKRLATQDLDGSLAHVNMLAAQGLINSDDHLAIRDGLKKIKDEIVAGQFEYSRALEDIHMNIEGRLTDLIGAPAGRLHTARSRNDQVATDFRLWVRDTHDGVVTDLKALLSALLEVADQEVETILPGYTHLQPAQPVSFAHHLLAYVEMFGRDLSRIQDARARMNECPLGAGALAGTSFNLNRNMTSDALGFDAPMRNSMDAVSDRDFALEFLSAGALIAMHLSRLAEELVNWSNPGFGFVTMSDQFSTGSSMMPQKRNPDAAELVRAKIGRVFGAFSSLLITLKGLPLTYSKDMQEDKEITFMAADALELALKAMIGMIQDLTINRSAMRAACEAGFLTATDLADWLVQDLGIPFREAHHITGRAVAMAEREDKDLKDLSLAQYQSIHGDIHAGVFERLTIEASVNSRTSFGGTAPSRVREAIAAAKKRFG
mgnify:FL=1